MASNRALASTILGSSEGEAMKVYRGPSTVEFGHESHELVDSADAAGIAQLWHDCVILRVNISKDAQQRQAVAHIELEAADVVALHAKLVTGLLARSANLAKAERRAERATTAACSIFQLLSGREDEGDDAIDRTLDLVNEIVELSDVKTSS